MCSDTFECSNTILIFVLFCFSRRYKVLSFYLFFWDENEISQGFHWSERKGKYLLTLKSSPMRTKIWWERGKWGWRDFLLKIPKTGASCLACILNLEHPPSAKIWHRLF